MLWLSFVLMIAVMSVVAFGALRRGASLNGFQRVLHRLGAILFFGGLLNALVFWHIAVALGGDAVSGKVVKGRYYLASHGKYTEVSTSLYEYSLIHTVSTWVTYPLALLGGLLMYKSERLVQDAT